MNDRILRLVDDAKALNSKIFSLPRLLILVSIENLGEDGATYRELKAGLGLDDGVLYSNLNALIEMGYVVERDVKLERRKMSSYSITGDGREALSAVRVWLRKWLS